MSTVTTWTAFNRARLAEELARVRGYLAALPPGRPGLPDPPAHADPLAHANPPAGPPRTADRTPPLDPAFAGADTTSPAAIDELCALFTLSPFERDVLLLCAGVELDAGVADLVIRTQGGGRPQPTFGLALACLPAAHWSALTPDGPLRAWHLVELLAADLTTAPLRLDERILHHLAGVVCSDDRLQPLLRTLPEDAGIGSYASEVEALARRLEGASSRELLQLTGADAGTRRVIAAAACRTAGATPLGLDAEDIPVAAGECHHLARLIARETILSRSLLVLDVGPQEPPARVARFVNRLQAPVVVLSDHPVRDVIGRTPVVIDVHRPAGAERGALWREALGPHASALDGGTLQAIAAQFDVSPTAMRRVAASLDQPPSGQHLSPADATVLLWDAARAESRPRLDALAQRITSAAAWDDLVLPDTQRQTLRAIARDVRHRSRVYDEWGFAAQGSRGLGITALFAGPSGTGKTLAAEVLANDLRLDLYRVDLAGIVSKYIGETEKNLAKLFAGAEGTGVVLLFDEADALFGKRSEVRDSHDRYANIEVSYLLQRMEAYRGLAILTSNQRTALDPARTRRLRYIVTVPFPDRDARAEIWRRSFPSQTPTAGLDPARLAQLNLAGGHIRNIALAGAFLAADRDEPVTMTDLAAAARAEYAKLERPLADAEIRGW